MSQSKVGDPEFQARVVELLQNATMPVSVDYIAHNLSVSWTTARAILFELSMKDRIKAQKTSKSWIFWMPESESEGVRKKALQVEANCVLRKKRDPAPSSML